MRQNLPPISEPLPRYDIHRHLNGRPQEIRHLFMQLRGSIQALAQEDKKIHEVFHQRYIAYKGGRIMRDFCAVKLDDSKLRVNLHLKENDRGRINDPKNIIQDYKGKGNFSSAHYWFPLSPMDDLSYATSLIRQVYNLMLHYR
jgi:predicted transport protein